MGRMDDGAIIRIADLHMVHFRCLLDSQVRIWGRQWGLNVQSAGEWSGLAVHFGCHWLQKLLIATRLDGI